MLLNVVKRFALIYLFLTAVILGAVVGGSLVEHAIGRVFGCTMEEGVVLVSLYCHRQEGALYTFIQETSAAINIIGGIIVVLMIVTMVHPLGIALIVFGCFVFEGAKAERAAVKRRSGKGGG